MSRMPLLACLVLSTLAISARADLIIDGPFTLAGPPNGVRTTGPPASSVNASTFLAVPGVESIVGDSAIIGLLGMRNAFSQFIQFAYTFPTPISISDRLFALTFDYISGTAGIFSNVNIAIQASTDVRGFSIAPNGDEIVQVFSSGVSDLPPPGTTLFFQPRFNPLFTTSELSQIRYLSFRFTYPINYDLGGETTISLRSIFLKDL